MSKKIKNFGKQKREFLCLFENDDRQLEEKIVLAVSGKQAAYLGRCVLSTESLYFIRVIRDVTNEGTCLPNFPGMDEPVELPPARPYPAEPYVGGAGQFGFKKKVRGGERWFDFCVQSKKNNNRKCDDLPLFRKNAGNSAEPQAPAAREKIVGEPFDGSLPAYWEKDEVNDFFYGLPLCAECGLIDPLVASGQIVCPNCG